MKRRRLKRHSRKNTRKIIIISSIALILCMTIGYAAFSTNINITAKGNILKKGIDITDNIVNSGDGLYVDIYEEGRYVYKGANPNNYITFNNELWRIIAKETDGTYKIVKNESIGSMPYDERNDSSSGPRYNENNTYCCNLYDGEYMGCNAWAANDEIIINSSISGTVTQDASLNTYLNKEYYNSLGINEKNYIVEHNFNVGWANLNNNISQIIETEKNITWTGKIAIINLSDFMRASASECEVFYTSCSSGNQICSTNNFLFHNTSQFLLTMEGNRSSGIITNYSSGGFCLNGNFLNMNIYPVLYLSSYITITSGTGTETDPYQITL